MANWGGMPPQVPGGRRIDISYRLTAYVTTVGWWATLLGRTGGYEWLRKNPTVSTRPIGLALNRPDGTRGDQSDRRRSAKRRLWRMLVSGLRPVGFQPKSDLCSPDCDSTAVAIDSPLAAEGRLAFNFTFPYGSPEDRRRLGSRRRHRTVLISAGRQRYPAAGLGCHHIFVIFFTGAEVNARESTLPPGPAFGCRAD